MSLEHPGKNLFLVSLLAFHGLLTFFCLRVHHSNLHFHLHIVFHFVTVSKSCPIILRPPAILIWPHPLPYFIMKNHFHVRWPCEVSSIAPVGQRDTVQTRKRCAHLERMFENTEVKWPWLIGLASGNVWTTSFSSEEDTGQSLICRVVSRKTSCL